MRCWPGGQGGLTGTRRKKACRKARSRVVPRVRAGVELRAAGVGGWLGPGREGEGLRVAQPRVVPRGSQPGPLPQLRQRMPLG